jgi:hypothetical protein
MKAATFWSLVVSDESEFLDRILALLAEAGIKYCLIGGQAVNAYVEPVVSLDLNVAVTLNQIAVAEEIPGRAFQVERFAHSVNVSEPGSDLRVQVQTDPRYAAFVEHAEVRSVLGRDVPVARIEDVLQRKVWAASDPARLPGNRLKDFADIARILESRPDLSTLVPDDIRSRLY